MLLHVTNGSAANEQLQAAAIPGQYLSWDDPLHQGPLPQGLGLHEMSAVRARFVADQGWAELHQARQRFRQRDQRLEAAGGGEVVLWSSSELYDQLHLLQLLSWFEQHRGVVSVPFAIWLEGHFSDHDENQLQALYQQRRRLDEAAQSLAAEIWQAVTAPEPRQLVACLGRPLPGLPFVGQALGRLIEEYPDAENGLSRTEREVLQVLATGGMPPAALFAAVQALEAPAFMGDWSFWRELHRLLSGPRPALRVATGGAFVHPPKVAPDSEVFSAQLLELTSFGQELADGVGDFVRANAPMRWIGGVRLSAVNDWRWDGEAAVLT